VNISEVEHYLHTHIPLSRDIGVSVTSVGEEGVTLAAPLQSNLNHQSTAFGGSISALAILSGWTYLCMRLRGSTEPSRIVIQRSEVNYLQPILGEFTARCVAPTGDEWDRFWDLLQKRGKGRIVLESDVTCDGTRSAAFTGTYVAFK
jgi:thioesterase domain-containing protein